MENEIWKDIPGLEGIYQASSLGRIKSLSREIVHWKGGTSIIKERVLKATTSGRGYKYVHLRVKGKCKFITVHQLVAMAFLGHKPNRHRLVIDHINGNKTDNRLVNIRVVTQRENIVGYWLTKKKKSKYLGVTWHSKNNKWMAQISINGKNKYLGLFENEHEAHLAYQNEIKKTCSL